MKSFAFIVSPTTTKQIRRLWPTLSAIPNIALDFSFKRIRPFKIAQIKIKSFQNKEIEGYIIVCPLLPQLMPRLEEDYALERIIAASQIADKLGARIIGLDGYAGQIANKNYPTISKRIKLPVTCGDALSAWSIFEAIYRVARIKLLNLKDSTLTVIGATNSTGNLCSRKLADYVSRIVINAQNNTKLAQLKEAIQGQSQAEVIIDTNINTAVRESDIVINTEAELNPIFDPQTLKAGSIFCYNSSSGDIPDKIKSLNSTTVIENGIIKIPFLKKAGFNSGLAEHAIGAPLAETILLTLEEKFISYSLGENINLDKLEDIANISVRQGFEVWVPQAPVL